MGCNPPDSSVHGILQAGILEWVFLPSSRRSSQPRDQTQVSCIAGIFLTTELPGKTLVAQESKKFFLEVFAISPHEWVSQAALVVKNLPATAGDIRDVSWIPR